MATLAQADVYGMHLHDQHMLAPMVDKLTRRSHLGSAEIQAILALPHRLATIHRGRHLVREGDMSDSSILLRSGFAYRSKIAGNGGRQILSCHLMGDLIDLQHGLLGEADCSVTALTSVEIAYIPQEALLDVAAAYPAITRALWCDAMVDGAILREWMLNVGQRNARQRVSHLLCELALRQEEAGLYVGPRYAWPMTQEQIGDATGLTSVHVNRTIQGLRKEGLIDIRDRLLTITDWPKLQRAGDFSRAYLHQPTALDKAA